MLENRLTDKNDESMKPQQCAAASGRDSIDRCCFYDSIRNSLAALLEAPIARKFAVLYKALLCYIMTDAENT